MKLYQLYLLAEQDYRGSHLAPDKNDTPLWDMTREFPDDIYSFDAYKNYGYISNHHHQAITIIQDYENKPNKTVRIYRAIPDPAGELKTKLKNIIKLKKYVYEYRFLPLNYEKKYSQYVDIPHDLQYEGSVPLLDFLDDIIDELGLKIKELRNSNYTINAGDWVALTKGYVIDHGKSHLNNQYLIKSKVVPAKHVFTYGDVTEWGYDPS
jgi:hypothetical protein